MSKQITPEAANLAEGWSFYWPVMDVLIGGKSAIDLPYLTIYTPSEAYEFLKNYGFDLNIEEDRRKAHAIIIEAWSFIESTLMPMEWKSGIQPPEKLLKCSDPRQFIIWASSTSEEDKLLRAWSCAVLRVAHTAAHMDGVWAMIDANAAMRQIRERFEPFLHFDQSGIWFGDERDRVQLEHIEWKVPKTRRSVFLKLLHKPGNVAENIYDLLGVRIVTKRLCDTMLVLKYLRDFHVVTYANCNPGRVRNNLIDLDTFHNIIDKSRADLLKGDIKPKDFYDALTQIDQDLRLAPLERLNPHSSEAYQAIQLTCRQLIKSSNSALEWVGQLEDYVRNLQKSKEGDTLNAERFLNYVYEWPGFKAQTKVESFFPFEVQIMDQEAYQSVKFGEASHERYKMSQVRTARRRILNEVFRLVRIQSGSIEE